MLLCFKYINIKIKKTFPVKI